MRPRVFPAEDVLDVSWRRTIPLVASMRPRVFPAEDYLSTPYASRILAASMRPRVFPAEDCLLHRVPRQSKRASMRPRVFPAEDPPRPVAGSGRRQCFNEAAGIPRGRRRPRAGKPPSPRRFNEAAGIPRGRRARSA